MSIFHRSADPVDTTRLLVVSQLDSTSILHAPASFPRKLSMNNLNTAFVTVSLPVLRKQIQVNQMKRVYKNIICFCLKSMFSILHRYNKLVSKTLGLVRQNFISSFVTIKTIEVYKSTYGNKSVLKTIQS